MSNYDRWLCDGPTVNCDGCGRSLGRLHDGRGEREDGRRTCDGCESKHLDRLADEREEWPR